jgi:hypothetical protein
MVVQMLDTAFHKEKPSLLKKTRMRALSKSQNKMWSYVGRFLWGFTMVEYELDQLCHQLLSPDFLDQEDDDSRKKKHGLGYAASLYLRSLDLRKKSKLVEIILRDRGIDESMMFKRIHALHDLRNVFAHWPFDEELEMPGVDSGIYCDFINAEGDTGFHRKHKADAKINLITYAELDRYDVEASELYEKLEALVETATPIMEPSEDLRKLLIEEAIKASDNVLRFPVSLRDDNTDKSE